MNLLLKRTLSEGFVRLILIYTLDYLRYLGKRCESYQNHNHVARLPKCEAVGVHIPKLVL